MLDVSYKNAILKDLNFILETEKNCFNSIDYFKRHQVYHFLKNPNNSIITDIIMIKDLPIGWACYFTRKKQNFLRLYSICILPQFSGKGYGKEYLQKRIKEFLKDFSKIILEVRASNKKAIRLYESIGFKKKKILPGYYIDEDGIKMIYTFPKTS